MIVHDFEQGSPEWRAARLGIPTASAFAKILTPATHKLSQSSSAYAHELLAEWLLGCPLDDDVTTGYMQRGTELEAEAVAYYEFERGVDTRVVGFVTDDEGTVGCSPDRLVGDDGGLEIKCPGPKKHVANLLGMGTDYAMQVHGCIWLCERQWWDVLSYAPSMPSVIVRVERDDELVGKLANAMERFLETLADGKERLLAMGATPVPVGNPGARCQAKRDDGRDCMSPRGVTKIGGQWRCVEHAEEVVSA